MARDYLNELMQKRSAILGTPSSNSQSQEFDVYKNRDNYLTRMQGSGVDTEQYTDKRNFIEKSLNLPDNQNILFDALEIIGRPQQAIFGAIDSLQYGENPLEGAWKGLTGEKKTTGGQIIRNLGIEGNGEDKLWGLDDWLGFGLDVFLDPADLVLFGAGKVAKGAKDTTKALTKADDALDAVKGIDKALDVIKVSDDAVDATKGVIETIGVVDDVLGQASKTIPVDQNLIKSTLDASDATKTITDGVKKTTKGSKEKALDKAKETVLRFHEAKKKAAEMAAMAAEETADEAPDLISKIRKNFTMNKTKYSLTDWYFNKLSGTVKSAIDIGDEMLGRMFEVLDKTNAAKGVTSKWSEMYKGAKLNGQIHFNYFKTLPKDMAKAITSEMAMYKIMHGKAAEAYQQTIEEIAEYAKKYGLSEQEIHIVLQREFETDTIRSMKLGDLTPLGKKADGTFQPHRAFRFTPENAEIVERAYGIGTFNTALQRQVEADDIYRIITNNDTKEVFMAFTDDAGLFLLDGMEDEILSFERVRYGKYDEAYQRIASTPEYQQLYNSVKNKVELINNEVASYLGIQKTDGYIHRAITKEAKEEMKKKNLAFTDNITQEDMTTLIGRAKLFQNRKYVGDALEANSQVKAMFDYFMETKVKDMLPEEAAKFADAHKVYKMFEEDLMSSMADYIVNYPSAIRDIRTVVDVLATSMFKDINALEELLDAKSATSDYYKRVNEMLKYFGDEATGSLYSPEDIESSVRNTSNLLSNKKEQLQQLLKQHADNQKLYDDKMELLLKKKEALKAKISTPDGDNIDDLKRQLKNINSQISRFKKKAPVVPQEELDLIQTLKDEIKEISKQREKINRAYNFYKANPDLHNLTKAELENVQMEFNKIVEQIENVKQNQMIRAVPQTYQHNRMTDKLYNGHAFKERLKQLNGAIDSPVLKKIIDEIDENKNYLIDKRIAKYIEVDQKKNASLLLNMFDKFTGMFKSAKLLNPSFNIRNTMGVYTNLYLSGMTNEEIGKYMIEAQKIFSKQDEVMKKFINLNSELLASGALSEDIMSPNNTVKVSQALLDKFGITDEDIEIYQKIKKFTEAGFTRANPVDAMSRKFSHGIGSAVGADFEETFAQSIKYVNEQADKLRLAQASGDAVKINLAKEAYEQANTMLNKVIMYNMYLNEYVDSMGRMAVMLKGLDNPEWLSELGVPDVESAIRFVMFDPYELSDFERNWMRRIIPFYTFSKKNLQYQMANIGQNGSRYYRVYKALKASYNMSGINMEDVQDFKLNQFYIPVPLGDERYGVIKANLPISELGEWMSEPVTKALSSMNPLIKAPIELSTNKNLFTGGTISDFEGQRGYAIDSLFGIPIDRKQEYLIGMTGWDAPISSIKRIENFIGSDDKSLESLGEAIGIYKSYDINKDKEAKAYEQLIALEDAMKYYKQEGIDILTLKELEAKAYNPELNFLKRKLDSLLK